MARSQGFASIPPAVRPQLQMAGALARERLMDVHFRYAMELVDHARGDMGPSRALSIYSRLHALPEPLAGQLYHKVFVALGKRNTSKPASDESETDAPIDGPQSIMGVIRRRLRGRVNTELREWVEYHTGRAETELLWTHVENALQYVTLLDPVLGMGDAVALYAQDLEVPAGRTETIYYLALAHRSASSVLTSPDEDAESPRLRTALLDAPKRPRPVPGGRRSSRRRSTN